MTERRQHQSYSAFHDAARHRNEYNAELALPLVATVLNIAEFSPASLYLPLACLESPAPSRLTLLTEHPDPSLRNIKLTVVPGCSGSYQTGGGAAEEDPLAGPQQIPPEPLEAKMFLRADLFSYYQRVKPGVVLALVPLYAPNSLRVQ